MNEPELRPFDFDGDSVRAVVTTRHGGCSTGVYSSLNLGDHVGDDHDAVLRNRELVARALGVSRLTVPDQQHTATVAFVDESNGGAGHSGADEARRVFPATDALVTDVTGVALSIMVADCTPVLLYDAEHAAIGAAHCGRAGVVSGVLPATISLMAERFGTDPGGLRVGVGPGICRASYEVGPSEAEQLASALPGVDVVEQGDGDRWLADLRVAVRHQLREAGVRDEQVDVMEVDTRTHTDVFFSDRAQRPCGRFMAIVALPAR